MEKAAVFVYSFRQQRDGQVINKGEWNCRCRRSSERTQQQRGAVNSLIDQLPRVCARRRQPPMRCNTVSAVHLSSHASDRFTPHRKLSCCCQERKGLLHLKNEDTPCRSITDNLGDYFDFRNFITFLRRAIILVYLCLFCHVRTFFAQLISTVSTNLYYYF